MSKDNNGGFSTSYQTQEELDASIQRQKAKTKQMVDELVTRSAQAIATEKPRRSYSPQERAVKESALRQQEAQREGQIRKNNAKIFDSVSDTQSQREARVESMSRIAFEPGLRAQTKRISAQIAEEAKRAIQEQARRDQLKQQFREKQQEKDAKTLISAKPTNQTMAESTHPRAIDEINRKSLYQQAARSAQISNAQRELNELVKDINQKGMDFVSKQESLTQLFETEFDPVQKKPKTPTKIPTGAPLDISDKSFENLFDEFNKEISDNKQNNQTLEQNLGKESQIFIEAEKKPKLSKLAKTFRNLSKNTQDLLHSARKQLSSNSLSPKGPNKFQKVSNLFKGNRGNKNKTRGL